MPTEESGVEVFGLSDVARFVTALECTEIPSSDTCDTVRDRIRRIWLFGDVVISGRGLTFDLILEVEPSAFLKCVELRKAAPSNTLKIVTYQPVCGHWVCELRNQQEVCVGCQKYKPAHTPVIHEVSFLSCRDMYPNGYRSGLVYALLALSNDRSLWNVLEFIAYGANIVCMPPDWRTERGEFSDSVLQEMLSAQIPSVLLSTVRSSCKLFSPAVASR